MLNKVDHAVGIPFHIAPHHTLRASPIILAMLSGQLMPAMMKRAQHASADTTTKYFDEAAAGRTEVSRAVYAGR